MAETKRRLGIHPHLARVAGVAAPPGMAWQIGHYIFIPCEDQVHGDGQPDLESVALMPSMPAEQAALPPAALPPAAATVAGNWPVGTTRNGGKEVWNGQGWVPNTPITIGATRGGGAEVFTGAGWVPNPNYRRPGAGVSGIAMGATRGGGAEVYTAQGWVPNPAYQGGNGGGIAIGATRGGGAEVYTAQGWVPNPAYQGQHRRRRLVPWQSTKDGGSLIWDGSSFIPNPNQPPASMGTGDALQLAGLISGQPAQSSSPFDLSASDLVALGAEAAQGAQGGQPSDQSGAGNGGDGGDLLDLLQQGGGDSDAANAIDLED